jgi:WD40 repeat protein
MHLSAGLDQSPLQEGVPDKRATLITDFSPSGTTSRPVIPGYQIIRELGRGGMGVVYEALQLSLKRQVALKVVHSAKDEGPEVQRRFQRETRAAALLTHPNIVTVYDAGLTSDYYYLAMQFIDGVDLERLVERNGPLAIEEACSYIRQAALGLQHASEQGLVHRDIKPANLIVTQGEAGKLPNWVVEHGSGEGKGAREKVVKILDLGLARLNLTGKRGGSESSLTQEGMIMGTPDYIAPEQLEDSHSVDVRADLFSLGCSFYFLLTGNVPFPGRSSLEKLDRLRWGRPRPLERLRRDVPTDIAAIVRKLMAKDPKERYQTPAELAAALATANLNPPSAVSAAPAASGLPQPASSGPGLPAPKAPLPTRNFKEEFKRLQSSLEKFLESNSFKEAQNIVGAMLVLKPKDSVALTAQAFIEEQLNPAVVGECGRFDAHGHWIWSVAFFPDTGRREPRARSEPGALATGAVTAGAPLKAVAGGGDKKIYIWDLHSGKKLRSFVAHHDAVKCVAVSPDGNRLLSGGKDNTVRLWEAQVGQKIRSFHRHTDVVESVAFSPNGRQLLSGSRDKSVRLWDVDGQKLHHFRGHAGDVKAVAFSSDGKWAISGSWDHTVRLWDVDTGLELRCLYCHMNLVSCVALSRDKRHLLAAGSDNLIYYWDLERDTEPQRWHGHDNLVTGVTFSPDGKRALSASYDQSLRLWDVATGKEIRRFDGHTNWVTSVDCSPDGRFALTGSSDKTMRLWRLPA